MTSRSVSHGTNRYAPRVDPPGTASGPTNTSALFAVQNVAEIEAVDTTTLEDGTGLAMRSVLDIWLLNRESTLTPDGITVAAALGGGNWVRQLTTSAEWKSRTVWHIDAFGNDENDGATLFTALATVAEYYRRTGTGGPPGVVVHIDSAITQDILSLEPENPNDPYTPAVTFIGGTTVIYSGTVSGVVSYDPISGGGGVIGTFSDAGLPVSFTASGLVGKKMILTSGANAGAVGYIAKETVAKTAVFSPLWDNGNFTTAEPLVGDTYDVVETTEVTGAFVKSGSGYAVLQDLRFNSENVIDVHIRAGTCEMRFCELIGRGSGGYVVEQGGFGSALGCRIASDGFESDVSGTMSCFGAFFDGFGVTCHNGTIAIAYPTLILNAGGDNAIKIDDAGFMRLEAGGWLAIADTTSGGAIVALEETGRATLSDFVFGTGNTCAWFFQVTGGCCISTVFAAYLNLGGVAGTSDVVIGSANFAYAALPTTDAANMAGVVLVA